MHDATFRFWAVRGDFHVDHVRPGGAQRLVRSGIRLLVPPWLDVRIPPGRMAVRVG